MQDPQSISGVLAFLRNLSGCNRCRRSLARQEVIHPEQRAKRTGGGRARRIGIRRNLTCIWANKQIPNDSRKQVRNDV